MISKRVGGRFLHIKNTLTPKPSKNIKMPCLKKEKPSISVVVWPDTPHPHVLNILVYPLAWLVVTLKRVARQRWTSLIKERFKDLTSLPHGTRLSAWLGAEAGEPVALRVPSWPVSPGSSWHHHLTLRLNDSDNWVKTESKSLSLPIHTTFL